MLCKTWYHGPKRCVVVVVDFQIIFEIFVVVNRRTDDGRTIHARDFIIVKRPIKLKIRRVYFYLCMQLKMGLLI